MTPVSQPNVITSGLRCLEFEFDIPDIGTPPEYKIGIYRLKNLTDNTYITEWKEYKAVANGQNIKPDFVADMYGVLSAVPPPFNVGGIVTDNTIIKKIAVEYGTRTINTVTCAPAVDVVEGMTDPIDVLNGVPRFYQGIGSVGTVLNTRKRSVYSVNPESKDWLYVIGNMFVTINFFDSSNNPISSVSHSIVSPHPGSVCSIIPCGFQIAPAGTNMIQVLAKSNGVPSFPNDWVQTTDGNFCADDEGSMVDVYFQTNMGANELLSFNVVDPMNMNVAKQEIITRFRCANVAPFGASGRFSINNKSYPTFTLKRQFKNGLMLNDSHWLNEIAASGSAWIVEELNNGFKVMLKIQLTDGNVTTYSNPDEFTLTAYFSEVYLFPY